MSEAPTILVVANDHAIHRQMRHLAATTDWVLHIVDSGSQGLELLQSVGDVDLVLSALRMPEMNGPEFLAHVREEWPRVYRLLLCRDIEKRGAARALAEGCAQQLVHLPWDEVELQPLLQKYLQQSRAQRSKGAGLQVLLNNIPSLPSLPDTYLELRDCLAAPEGVDLERVTAIVSRDVGNSAVLLRWANSALTGQMSKVDTVRRAVVVLGTDIVEWLTLSRALKDTLGQVAVPGFDIAALQTHSVGCAVLARHLARREYPGDFEMADRAFTAGMLHDLGKLIAATYLTAPFGRAVAHALAYKGLLADAEREIVGHDHAEIGGYLASWWNLPPFIVQAIRWHHDPGQSPTERAIVSLVHVANSLIQEFGVGRSGNYHPPEVDRDRWERFNLTPEVMAELQEQVKDLSGLVLE